MRVRHLKMHSYRGLGDLEIDFDTVEPTVFIGINGSGKSSILDCIALLLSSFINRIAAGKDDASENIFSVRDLTIPEESSELRSELTNEFTIALSIA
ncbi:MAG TPA: AAA family ATPase [Chroococcidiopsis sp.]